MNNFFTKNPLHFEYGYVNFEHLFYGYYAHFELIYYYWEQQYHSKDFIIYGPFLTNLKDYQLIIFGNYDFRLNYID
jgi:hypothetical protein